ncbi:MAG: ester cyclase [Thermoleophilaceae bacterium]
MAETKTRTRRPPKRKLVEGHARSYFEALAGRNPGAMATHWSRDGVADIVPLAVLRGPDELKGFFRELFAAFPGLETTVTRVVADDKHAVVEWRMSGTFSGTPFQGIEPTGREVDLRGIDILEIQEQQILTNTAYYDGAEFARQVGMLPPRDSGPERAIRNTFNAVTKVRKALQSQQ